jgi:hypothetical protein
MEAPETSTSRYVTFLSAEQNREFTGSVGVESNKDVETAMN